MDARPKGDPGAMKAVAAAFGQIASGLAGLASAAPNVLPAAAFSGPGRSEHDTALQDASKQATFAANALEAEAKLLDQGATKLAHAQKEWDRLKREETARHEREARERAERATR